MMIKYFFLLVLLTAQAIAYVPTVESLLRNGQNGEVKSSFLALTLKISKVNPGVAEETEKPIFSKFFYTLGKDSQLRMWEMVYGQSSLSDTSILYKHFADPFSPTIFGDTPVDIERGLFFSTLNSVLINDGSFMVDFLKSKGHKVFLNEEILNNAKKELISEQRQYLIKQKAGGAGNTSPLQPGDAATKEKVKTLMSQPMFTNTSQVSLDRCERGPCWKIKEQGFEAFIDDQTRQISKVSLKGTTGDIEIQLKDYRLMDGEHSFPSIMYVQNHLNELYKIEVLELKHTSQNTPNMHQKNKELDPFVKKLKEVTPRPSFIW